MDKMRTAKNRPGWVWVICIFYAFSFVWTLLSWYLLFSGNLPSTPETRAYFSTLGIFDYGLSIVQVLLSLSSATALFMLRKQATYLFWTSAVIGTLAVVWNIAVKNWLLALKSMKGAGTGAIIGVCLLLAVCFYAEKLKKQGTLT